MEYPFAGVKSGIVTAQGWKYGSLVWSQLCHNSHCVLGLHFDSLGLSIFFSMKQEAGVMILAPNQPVVLARVFRKGRGAQKNESTPLSFGEEEAQGHTVFSDTLMVHGNCWEEVASYSIRGWSNIKKATAAPEAVLALPPLSPARTPGNLR